MRKLPEAINGWKPIRLVPLILVMIAAMLKGQESGWIAGTVHDRSGAVVPGAEVGIQSEATGARQRIYCDAEGKYASASLTVGLYKVTVRHEGFRTVTKPGIIVQLGKIHGADFFIDILPVQQEVTVQANHDSSDPTANGLTVSRGSPQSTLPANGRDLHALYTLLPGAITTPAPTSDGGQFSVTGQRSTTNSFRIDGISGNAGIGLVSTPTSFPGATLPGMTTIGSTHSLASQEETQRVELKPLDFSPEWGERPGAQISVETRAGSNEFHGSALGYLRPQFLNSRDWFARNHSINLPRPSLHGWAGSLGGPVVPNRTFFFAAWEQTDVHDTALRLLPVPSLATRAAMGNAYQLFLEAFPLPIGPALNSTEALGAATLIKQGTVSNNSFRLDQLIGSKLQSFARYADVPSSSTTTDLGTALARFRWLSATAGFNLAWGRVTQQLRFNYSYAAAVSAHAAGEKEDQPAIEPIRRAFYASIPNVPYPGLSYTPFTDLTALSLAGVGQILSGPSGRNAQIQWEGAYNIAIQAGRHEFRAGADYINLHPSPGLPTDALSLVAPSDGALLAGDPLAVTISYSRPPYNSFGIWTSSTFIQDTLRLSERLTVLYGVRQEMTPPAPLYSNFGVYFPYIGCWKGLGTKPISLGSTAYTNTPSWSIKYAQLAPRLGLAYRLKAPDLILRAGGGIFYDTGFASTINANNANPLSSWQFFPLNGASNLTAETMEVPSLRIPRVWEWRVSVEKRVRPRSLLSLSYIGSAGRDLLRKEARLAPQTSLLETVNFTNNGRSDYQALQAQFSGNLTRNLYALVSYTWSHSIDNGSRDTAVFLTYPGYNDSIDRGSSSFDIRHALNASVEYRLPSPKFGGFLRPLLSQWNLSSTLQARAGFPFDVTTIDRSIGLGFENTGRPDLIAGVPLWLSSGAVPGGRQLNPAAFRVPQNELSGVLGRNVLTGPSLFQIDTSLRRQWRLYRGSSLEGSVAAFNTFNRASFANPVSYLGSALFGQSVSMTNLMLGSGTPTTGLTPIFQAGGPRTVEMSLKINF